MELAVPADRGASGVGGPARHRAAPGRSRRRDTLRLEAALPLHGHELGPGITPLQAGLGWVVAWDKDGGFRGRGALLAEKERGVARRLRGLAVEGRRPPRAEQAVLIDGRQAGVVTSGNFSPILGHGIALAFLPPEVDEGAEVAIEARGEALPARVVPTPFVGGGRFSAQLTAAPQRSLVSSLAWAAAFSAFSWWWDCTAFITAAVAAFMNSGRFSAAQSRLAVVLVGRALELGEHVAGHQLVAVPHGVAGRPVRGHGEEGAEAAGLVDEALDLGLGVVDGADHREARRVHGVGQLGGVVGGRTERKGGDPLEVVGPLRQAERHVLVGLLLGVGDVHRADQAPLAPVGDGAELGGALLHHRPVRAEHVEAAGVGGPDRQQRRAEAAGEPRARRRDLRGHGDLEARIGVRPQLEPGVPEGEPVGGAVHRLLAGEELEDRLEGLLHHVPLPGDVDPHHEGVRRQGTGADAEHHPATGEVVEQHHAVGQHQRLVVGERAHAGAEPEVLGALGGRRDEHLGAGDDLVARRVVLADPCLVEAEGVEVLQQVEVALEGERGVLPDGVERSEEDAELQGPVHGPGAYGQDLTVAVKNERCGALRELPGDGARVVVDARARRARRPGTGR